MQKTQNVINPAAIAEAVLSHSLRKQVEDFTASRPAPGPTKKANSRFSRPMARACRWSKLSSRVKIT